jgi:hypothetical protein
MLAEAMEAGRIDRSSCLIEAKQCLEPVVAKTAHSATCAALGWLRERLGHNLFEAEQVYLHGVVEGVRRRDMGFLLCARQLAFVQYRSGRFDDALSSVEKALLARSDGDILTDVGRYALAAKQLTRARDAWAKALRMRPLSVFDLFAEGDSTNAIQLELGLAMQQDARHDAIRQLEKWESASENIAAAEKQFGSLLEIPGVLRTGFRAAANPATANIFQALSIASDAENRGAELLESAKRQLQEEVSTRQLRSEAAKQELESLLSAKDEASAQLTSTKEAAQQQARATFEQALKDSGAQRGCTLSASAGCGMMALYVVAYLALTTMGIHIGPETSLGKILLILIGLPFVAGAILQVGAGVKRTALEAEAQRSIAEAQARFEQGNQALIQRFKAPVAELREKLSRAEVDSRHASEALALLSDK